MGLGYAGYGMWWWGRIIWMSIMVEESMERISMKQNELCPKVGGIDGKRSLYTEGKIT